LDKQTEATLAKKVLALVEQVSATVERTKLRQEQKKLVVYSQAPPISRILIKNSLPPFLPIQNTAISPKQPIT